MGSGIKIKYDALVQDLRVAMLNGDIKAGDKLPSENELANKYSISRQTVRKALQVLHDEGYIYAEHGRGTFCSGMVKTRKNSKNIAVITTYLSDYIFPRVINGIDEVMTEKGYSIILKNTNNSRSREAKCLEELLQKDIEGLIIEPSKSQILCSHLNLYEILDQYKIPYVFIQGCYSSLEDKPRILMDDRKGGFLVTEYLIKQGHRDIVGVFKADDIQGQERHKGYIQALQQAGIAYDPDKVIWFYTEDRKRHPKEQIAQMAKNRKKLFFDAVVAYNDQVAVQIMEGLEQEGLTCPTDVSVTGYDNSYLAEACKVPLTTVTHPQEQLGRMAAELLMRFINNEQVEKEEAQILIEPKLVIRESTRAL